MVENMVNEICPKTHLASQKSFPRCARALVASALLLLFFIRPKLAALHPESVFVNGFCVAHGGICTACCHLSLCFQPLKSTLRGLNGPRRAVVDLRLGFFCFAEKTSHATFTPGSKTCIQVTTSKDKPL